MKKVARLRVPQEQGAAFAAGAGEHVVGVRTTGRIKKPKTVYDPSDNYLPRSQRASNPPPTAHINASSSSSSSTSSVSASASASASVSASVSASASVSVSTANTPAGTANTVPPERKSEPRTMSIAAAAERKIESNYKPSHHTALPERTSLDNAGADNADYCAVCLKREVKRNANARNKLIACMDCDRKVHKLCLHVDFEDIDSLRHHFKCENCRTCDVCDVFTMDNKRNKDLVTCVKCAKSFHLTCHTPNVLKFQQFQKNWKCNKCSTPSTVGSTLPVKTIREIIGDEPAPVSIVAAAAEAKTLAAGNVGVVGASAARKRSQTDLKVSSSKPTSSSASASASSSPSPSLVALSPAVVYTNGNIDASPVPTSLVRVVAPEYCADPKMKKKKYVHQHELDNGFAANVYDGVAGQTTPNTYAHNDSLRYSPNEPIDLPDVKSWSVDQVVEFFTKFFPREAHVFREHEIDGMSLLLLKRSDIIKKLPIKLGPSLRIYSLILKIQTQTNDPTLGWNCGT